MMGPGVLLFSAATVAVLHKLRRTKPTRASSVKYIPYSGEPASLQDCVVVDCTHPDAQTFTHHKKDNNPSVQPADCSTGIVLNALGADAQSPELKTALEKPNVTVNHFDADGLLAMWSLINRDSAQKHSKLLRCAARIGDFREVLLPSVYANPGVAPGEAIQDGVEFDAPTVDAALRLSCWINTQEIQRFAAPYEGKDRDEKFAFFLGALASALKDGPPETEFMQEYTQVMRGLASVREHGSVTRREDVGVTVVRTPQPLHYYSLFSWTAGTDVVIAVYGGRRYEVECKYTSYVNLHSRPVWPRVSMAPLAEALNAEEDPQRGLRWRSTRITDTGPVLRLEAGGEMLPKQELYGHPAQRRIHASAIPPERFEAVVLSFFEHALRGCEPRAGGWEWADMHAYNSGLRHGPWRESILAHGQ
eukprot:jgi/Ulvmu1/178/UM001_0182.1